MMKAGEFDGLNCLELTQKEKANMRHVLQRFEQNCVECCRSIFKSRGKICEGGADGVDLSDYHEMQIIYECMRNVRS